MLSVNAAGLNLHGRHRWKQMWSQLYPPLLQQLPLALHKKQVCLITNPKRQSPSNVGSPGIPYNEVLSKNRYVGRTFIQPDDRMRKLGVLKKFAAITANIVGKRVIIVDDSIVRGTTMGPIIKLLRDAGAKEVHIRVASPPLKHPCYMGINIPTRSELIANKKPLEELADYFGADSLAYLSLDGLKGAVQQDAKSDDPEGPAHCTACLSGEYPVEINETLDW
eukprot:m.130033 g.130033  ORF g.130033 m.130033 type:complete len:222 (+) comp15867_c0_seq10:1064-1729(+)